MRRSRAGEEKFGYADGKAYVTGKRACMQWFEAKSETTSRGKGETNNKERVCVEQKQKQAEQATERVTSRAANSERRTANKVKSQESVPRGPWRARPAIAWIGSVERWQRVVR